MARRPQAPKDIKDVFYEARVLMGREYTLKRFAEEVLEGAVAPMMLSYIEKGQRFPSDALVRRVAEVTGKDPHDLLLLLWQDRMLHAFGRELQRVLKGGKPSREPDEGGLAHVVSRAVAALPDDGSWIPESTWRGAVRKAIRQAPATLPVGSLQHVQTLVEHGGLVERRAGKVRRLARHYVPKTVDETRSLAHQYYRIFARSVLDKIVKQGKSTYVRNHYFQIAEPRIEEFYRRLNETLGRLVAEFATEDPSDRVLDVLVTSSPS